MKEEKLLNLLQKKRGFFEAILELSEEESKYSLNDWIAILKQKKILLSCVDKIDAELALFKDSFEVMSQEISEEIEKIKEIIEEILYVDSVNQEKRKTTFKNESN